MNIEDIKQNFTVEILDSTHDLSNFDCGNDDLNDFIKNDALIQKEWKINVTHLIIHDDNIIGFFSILADSIKIDLLTANDQILKSKTNYTFAPAIKIGRFALDKKYIKKGIGSSILIDILNTIFQISQKIIGIRYVTVDSYPIAFNFYKKNGFIPLTKEEKKIKKLDKSIQHNSKTPISLYFDLYRHD